MRLLLPLLLLFYGCLASAPLQELNPTVYYINDICVTYNIDKKNTMSFCGVGVLPDSTSYDLVIENDGKLNLFSMTSCHREKTTENSDKGIFKKDGVIKINYEPTVEKGKACPLYVAAFNKQGKNGWGTIFFEHSRYQLKANIECNGEKNVANGVSVCQSRHGLIQRIVFDNEVVPVKPVDGPAERKEPCPVLPSKDNRVFEFSMPPRECTYGFVEKETKKIHMLNTIGYEQLLVRE